MRFWRKKTTDQASEAPDRSITVADPEDAGTPEAPPVLLEEAHEDISARLAKKEVILGFGHPTAEILRRSYSDVSHFVWALTTVHSDPPSQLPFSQWEGLAVLGLWKLFDFYDMFFSLLKASNRAGKLIHAKTMQEAGPLLIESMQACTLAAEIRTRELQLAAIKDDVSRQIAERIYADEAKRRNMVSEQMRTAVNVRHNKTAEHRVKALEMANAGSFISRSAAARHVADLLQKVPGEFYTVRTVDRWLADAKWRPKSGAKKTT